MAIRVVPRIESFSSLYRDERLFFMLKKNIKEVVIYEKHVSKRTLQRNTKVF
jgi:hypothetical protein